MANDSDGPEFVDRRTESVMQEIATTGDYVEVAVDGAGTTGSSNPVPYTETCT